MATPTSDERIAWDAPGRSLAANPGATLALDRHAWERLGARFSAVDDGQGERPNLATGSMSTSGGPVPFGVLDYGESTTYLLVPGSGARHLRAAVEVLAALAKGGGIRPSHDLVDIAVARSSSDECESGSVTAAGESPRGRATRALRDHAVEPFERDGFTYDQIAAMLAMSRSSLDARLRRARSGSPERSETATAPSLKTSGGVH